ncbi:MAG TPA: hypothetical protein VGB83_08410 [Actinomycetota bacterium]
MKPSRILVFAALIAALGACRTAPLPPEDSTGLPAELGEPPAERSPRTGGSGAGTTQTEPEDGATPDSSPTGTAGGGPAPNPPFHTIATFDDPRGDHGTAVPAYADLARVQLRDNGIDARAIVTVGDDVPNPMPAGEQMAIGVDLYRRNGAESDYQVLAIGTTDGWLAYFTTPDGIVKYPGTFAIQGGTLTFQVPWSRLGNMTGRRYSAFLDWDREQPVVNRVGEDRAPRTGTEPFSR